MKKNQVQRKLEAFVADVQAKVEELLGGKKKGTKRRSKPMAKKKQRKVRTARKKQR